MQINVTFDSLEDLLDFSKRISGLGEKPGRKAPTQRELNESAMKATEIINRAEAKEAGKKTTPVSTKEPAPDPAKEGKPDPSEVKIYAAEFARSSDAPDQKEERRKQLKALLTGFGVKSVTELIDTKAAELPAFYEQLRALKGEADAR